MTADRTRPRPLIFHRVRRELSVQHHRPIVRAGRKVNARPEINAAQTANLPPGIHSAGTASARQRVGVVLTDRSHRKAIGARTPAAITRVRGACR